MEKKNKNLQAKEPSPDIGRRNFLIAAGTALVAVGAAGALYKYTEPLPAPHTVSAPERKEYLEELVKGAQMPYCVKVVYDHDGTAGINYLRELVSLCNATMADQEAAVRQSSLYFTNGNYDAKTPELLELAGTGRKSAIFVGRQFFENPEFRAYTANDLRHIITIHEYHHAVQHAKGLPWCSVAELKEAHNQTALGPNIIYSVYELDALHADFKDITGCSERLVSDQKNTFNKYSSFVLRIYNECTPLQKKIVRSVLDQVKDINLRN